MDPIETARAILAGELSETLDPEEDLEDTAIDAEIEEDLEEAKHKNNDDEDEDNDDEDDEETDEDYDVRRGKKVNKEAVVNPKSEEDKDLYKDAQGKGAKVAKPTGNASGKNKSGIKAKASSASGKIDTPTASGSSQERLEQHMTTLFDGEELTEQFKTKASTIFEAAINERVSEVEASLLEQYEEVIEEHTEAISKELAEKIDNYLTYVVEKWVEENEIAIETGIRADIAEDFMTGLKELFENSYVDVPEEKNDLVEQLAEAVVDLQDKLENEIARNIDLKSNVMESRCETILSEVSEGLVDTEAEKLHSLAEGIEFEDEDQYREKLNILRESYFGESAVSLNEEDSSNNQIETPAGMERYMSALSKSAKLSKENRLS